MASESESETEAVPAQVHSSFAALDDEEDSDDSSTKAEEEEATTTTAEVVVERPAPSASKKSKKGKGKKKGNNKKQQPKAPVQDEEQVLEEAARAVASSSSQSEALRRCVHFELNRVDASRELDARLGVGPQRKKGASTSRRRFIFGDPPVGYGEVPSFARGGLRWTKAEPPERILEDDGEWWSVIPSDRYAGASQALNSTLGDVNELGRLVAQHPFHAPTLLTLARFCAAAGLRQHCSPLLSRAVAVYEAGMPRHEMLRDLLKAAKWRVDVSGGEEHVALFASLFRTARQAAMTGAPQTAANLFGALLSMDPRSDPCYVLLRLDGELIAAERYQDALSLYDTPLPVGPGVRQQSSLELFEDPPKNALLDGGRLATTKDMPGVCLNRGLCLFRMDDREAAVVAVADALASFPHLLVCMLDACGVDPAKDRSTEFDFRELLWHDHFRKRTIEDGFKRSYQLGALPKAIDALCLRGRSLWKAPDALRLLHDGAASLIKRLGPGKVDQTAIDKADAQWSLSPLVKYAGAPTSEFKDDYELSLGPEASQAFDEQLISPEAAKKAAQMQQQQPQMQVRGAPNNHRGRNGNNNAPQRTEEEDALHDLLQQIPEEMRATVMTQAQEGRSLVEIQAALFSMM